MREIRQNLSPATAGATLQRSLALGMASVTEACRDLIWNAAEAALPTCHLLSPNVVEELLSSPLLCIEDYKLALLLLNWPQAGTGHDVGALLARHVQRAALSTEQQEEVASLAKHVGHEEQALWPTPLSEEHGDPEPTGDAFSLLRRKHRQQFPLASSSGYREQGPFLGYWLNLIPSRASFGKVWVESRFSCDLPRCPPGSCRLEGHRGRKLTVEGNDHVGNLQKMAANEMDMVLEAQSEMIWWMPHHRIYANRISFHSPLGHGTHLEVLSSPDGATWRALASVRTGSEEKRDVRHSFLARQGVQWFKLVLRAGRFQNRLRVGGTLEAV